MCSTKVRDDGLDQAHLSQALTDALQHSQIPAMTLAVMNSSDILFHEVQGVRVTGKHDKATLEDYFHIGSCAKSVLAVIAALLVEQHRIRWDTPFFELLPELKGTADSAYAGITLEDLLLCRAGIKSYTHLATEPLPQIDPAATDRRIEFARHLVQQPPSSRKSGDRFEYLYSNASYTMASLMLERVTGKKYEELAVETLATGIGIDVRIGWPNSIGPDQPWGHLIDGQRIETFGPEHEYRLPDLLMPAGDLSMTPRDYALYTQSHLRGLRGIDGLIPSAAFRHIHFASSGFALGVVNGKLAGRQYSGFDGCAGTFFCRSIIVPESDFALAIMANAGTATGSLPPVDPLTRRVAEVGLGLGWLQRLMLRLLW